MSGIIYKSEYFYLRELFSPVFPKKSILILKKTKNIWNKLKNINIGNDNCKFLLKEIYNSFIKYYPFEYVYKNELLKYILKIEKYKKEYISAITEIRIGNAKADFVFVNGCSEVFEIKTPLDTLNRLDNQLNMYFKVFDKVSLLVDKKYIDSLKELDCYKYLGIFLLENKKIVQIKEAELNSHKLDYILAFNLLRKEEVINVIKKEFNEDISYLPNIELALKARELFYKIDEDKAREYIKEGLKERNYLNRIKINKYPSSLSLMVNNIKKDSELLNLKEILNKNIREL